MNARRDDGRESVLYIKIFPQEMVATSFLRTVEAMWDILLVPFGQSFVESPLGMRKSLKPVSSTVPS